MTQVVYLGAREGCQAAAATLEGVAEVLHVPAEPPTIAQAFTVADAVLDASMKVRITDDMIRAAPRLRIISCATTGSDHIARGVLTARGIPVRTLQEDRELLRNITPAAELSWALLMACARRLPAALKHVIKGGWTREDFPGIMLNGKRLGLVGCGRIGSWMARYADAFGMDVIGYDPHLTDWPDAITRASLDEVFATSDFVSVHVPLRPKTEGLVSRSLIERMKPGAVLVNTSRAAVLDESALLDALESGRLAGAGLDVLTGEPEVGDHPLVCYARSHDDLLITPHCGGMSPDAVRVVCARAADKIRVVLMET